ncbi:hypothetical protein L207DRAFT_573195 [Hyaloscypha variabilis F]|uniref:DNA-binding protein RAP1 n=1 Tax=Hyaloscypha variabilis (strain UAMH 11265 / GT02V1 / F) TaxID=1149755 RepID=A0A2J6QXY6_HYAVF|nr:hypothetical protein L207DRAFT_573195 [Hyaloscypha variabilis F]
MASIVYEGVGGGGQLFAGVKFFLMQRLPTRDRWKGLVKANGGQVVDLEKQADLIIADHARKDIPPGSISWKFIEQSVAKGVLEDIEDHRAGPPVGTIREVGSVQPAKKGRTPFTAEDDRILMEWCIKAERKGLSLKGNDLYKQLEAKNNRHTFQSWRDHWIKDLSHRPRPTLSEDDEDGEEEEGDELSKAYSPKFRPPVRQQNTARTATVQRNAPVSSSSSRPPQARAMVDRKPARKSSPPPSSPVKPTAGNAFTDEDTELLSDAYEDILNLDEDHIIDAWVTWAENYPQHTAQEWRNYFKEYVAPRKSAEKKAKRISSPLLNRPQASAAASSLKVSPRPSNRTKFAATLSPSRDLPAQAREIRDSQDTPAQPTQAPTVKRRGSDPTLTDEQIFKHDLLALAQELELDVDFTPVICGRRVALFKLWQVVRSDDFGGLDRVNGMKLWPKVARFLSFKDAQQTTAAEDLKHCYEEILADLEEYQQFKHEQSLTESEEKAMLEAQLKEEAARETQNSYDTEDEIGEEYFKEEEEEDDLEDDLEEEEEDDDLDRRPQYSPRPPIPSSSSKRSFGADRTNVDTSYNKRQRIDKGKGKELEVPSTPEDVINNTQMPRPTFKPSPLKYSSPAYHQQQDEEADDSSEIEDLWTKPLQPQPKPKPPPQILEPETQDFNYPQTQIQPEEEEHDSYLDIPSSPPPRNLPDRSSGSNAANRGSDSNRPGSSTQSQTESEKAAALEQYIDVCIGFGYTGEAVALALDATTMETGNHAMQVMEALENGQEIPDDIPGVWTEEDDRLVEGSVDSEGYKDCVRKHGAHRCGVRKEFLRHKREVSELEEGAT